MQRLISTDRKCSENIIVKTSKKFSTSKFFSDVKFVSANQALQNFLSTGNFPEWKCALKQHICYTKSQLTNKMADSSFYCGLLTSSLNCGLIPSTSCSKMYNTIPNTIAILTFWTAIQFNTHTRISSIKGNNNQTNMLSFQKWIDRMFVYRIRIGMLIIKGLKM